VFRNRVVPPFRNSLSRSPRAICNGGLYAIRKESGLFSGSFLRRGEVFAYAGRNQNLMDQKALRASLEDVSATPPLQEAASLKSPRKGGGSERLVFRRRVGPDANLRPQKSTPHQNARNLRSRSGKVRKSSRFFRYIF